MTLNDCGPRTMHVAETGRPPEIDPRPVDLSRVVELHGGLWRQSCPTPLASHKQHDDSHGRQAEPRPGESFRGYSVQARERYGSEVTLRYTVGVPSRGSGRNSHVRSYFRPPRAVSQTVAVKSKKAYIRSCTRFRSSSLDSQRVRHSTAMACSDLKSRVAPTATRASRTGSREFSRVPTYS